MKGETEFSRAVIVFFENLDLLNKFKNSDSYKELVCKK
jgi:uncharacterized protein (DUF1330 family)